MRAAVLSLVMLLSLFLPASACERHLNGHHQSGTDSSQEAKSH